MSTPSQLYFGKGFFLCFATQILHPSGHSVAKKAGTAWEHWTSQIDDHLKPSTVAKRCTSLKSRKSPALRGFVAGRWALMTTSLYPSTKIERPQRAPNRAPGGVLSLNSDGPDSRRPTRGPMPPNALGRGTTSAPALKPAYRAHTAVTGVFLWASAPSRRVGAGHARKGARLPLAASQALCLPYHAPA